MFRYSLRSLFVATLVVACVFSWVSCQRVRLEQEADATRALTARFGSGVGVSRDGEELGILPLAALDSEPPASPRLEVSQLSHGRLYRPTTMVFLFDVCIDQDAWAQLGTYRFLEGMLLTRCRFDPSVEIDFSRFANLNLLSVNDTLIGAQWVQSLSQCQRLSSLCLVNAGPSAPWLKCVARLPDLRALAIEKSDVTDDLVEMLANATQLESLQLRGASITARSRDTLARLTHLKLLGLSATPFDDTASECLVAMKGLEQLYLSETRITDATLERVANLPMLWLLCVRDTQVSDAGALHLRRAPRLQSLDVSGTRITSRGVSVLAAVPSMDTKLLLTSDKDADPSPEAARTEPDAPEGESP